MQINNENYTTENRIKIRVSSACNIVCIMLQCALTVSVQLSVE